MATPRTGAAKLTKPIFSDWKIRTSAYDIIPNSGSFDKQARGSQPIHTVYGGANLFSENTFEKLGKMAVQSLDDYAGSSSDFESVFGLPKLLASVVHGKVRSKLLSAPIEDYRIDFEDGYGVRSAEEEEKHAVVAAHNLLTAMQKPLFPRYVGIRVKGLNPGSALRSLTTLNSFFSAIHQHAMKLPSPFIVTLPKIVSVEQVRRFVSMIDEIERCLKLEKNSLWLELLVEHPGAIDDGAVGLGAATSLPLTEWVRAAGGRCNGLHLGAYDYTSLLGISSSEQRLHHPACDFIRHVMQIVAVRRGVWVSDGASNFMPVPIHRAAALTEEQKAENRASVHAAWKACYDNVMTSLKNGYYQGWDLHPAQFIPRYAAVYAFFLASMDDTVLRLNAFLTQFAQATRIGSNFDDAATGHGLVNHVLRAFDCGAVDDSIFEKIGVSKAVLESRDFAFMVSKIPSKDAGD